MKIKNFKQFVNGLNEAVVNELSTDTMTRAKDAREKQGESPEELSKKYAVSIDNELYRLDRGVATVLAAAGFYDKCQSLQEKLRQLVKAGDSVEYSDSKGKYAGKLLDTLQHGGPWVDGSRIIFGELEVYNQHTKKLVELRADANQHPINDCKIYIDADKVDAIKAIVDQFEDLSKWVLDVTPKIVKFAKGEGHQVLTADLAKTLPDLNNFLAGAHELSKKILPLAQQSNRLQSVA